MTAVARETGARETLTIGSLFSGYGGLELGIARALDADVVWHAENAPAANRVLAARWPGVPNLGDVRGVDWADSHVDVVAAGFPCQDVSNTGLRRGLALGTRSGLWFEVVRAVAHLRPSAVIVENVRGLVSATAHRPLEPDVVALGDGSERPALRALGAVLGDLADLGFDAEWIGVRAADVAAPHVRFRIFLVATSTDARSETRDLRTRLRPSEPTEVRRGRPDNGSRSDLGRLGGGPPAHGPDVARFGRYADAVDVWEQRLGRRAPDPLIDGRVSPPFVEWMMGLDPGWVTDPELELTRAEQLRLLGNGVVPQQAEHAIRQLIARGH